MAVIRRSRGQARLVQSLTEIYNQSTGNSSAVTIKKTIFTYAFLWFFWKRSVSAKIVSPLTVFALTDPFQNDQRQRQIGKPTSSTRNVHCASAICLSLLSVSYFWSNHGGPRTNLFTISSTGRYLTTLARPAAIQNAILLLSQTKFINSIYVFWRDCTINESNSEISRLIL